MCHMPLGIHHADVQHRHAESQTGSMCGEHAIDARTLKVAVGAIPPHDAPAPLSASLFETRVTPHLLPPQESISPGYAHLGEWCRHRDSGFLVADRRSWVLSADLVKVCPRAALTLLPAEEKMCSGEGHGGCTRSSHQTISRTRGRPRTGGQTWSVRNEKNRPNIQI